MIYNTDYKYFDKARQVALISDFHKTHIGCVAVYQGNVIGIVDHTSDSFSIEFHSNSALQCGQQF